MAAFRLAVDEGIPGIELDVWRCASGELVVIHDRNLLRLAGLDRDVPDMRWEELQAIRVAGEPIPRLTEVLDSIAPHCYLDIEVKGPRRGSRKTAAVLTEVVRDRGLESRVLFSSFHPLLLLPLRATSAAPIALVYDGKRRPSEALWDAMKPGPVASACMRKKPHSVPWISWTIARRERARELLDVGAEGLISDDPGQLGL